MRRWLKAATRLYPRAWRNRYGAEFDALLDDVQPRWLDVADVLIGALIMRVKEMREFWKVAAAIAVTSCVTAIGSWFFAPQEYQSEAVLHVTETQAPPFPITDEVAYRWQTVTSRSNLAGIIQRSDINLYPDMRHRFPFEEIIEHMRRNISIRTLQNRDIAITFLYPDPGKAQLVVDALTDKLRNTGFSHGLVLVKLASLPKSPSRSERWMIALMALGGGLAAGILMMLLQRRRRWTIGFVACGLTGAVAGGGASFLLPAWYTSTSLLCVAPLSGVSDTPRRLMSDQEMTDWLKKKKSVLLSSAVLAELIQRPSLNLYLSVRKRNGLEAAIETMRHDIHIERQSPSAVQISFTYRDPYKAQLTSSAIASLFIDSAFDRPYADVTAARGNAFLCLDKHGVEFFRCIDGINPKRNRLEFLDILDPASLPITPVAPNRLTIAIFGMFGGLLLGAARKWGQLPFSSCL